MLRAMHTASTNAITKLSQPAKGKFAVLNVWSPGYLAIQPYTDMDGKVIQRKVFKPTTTFEAALAYLKNIHGSKELIKFKENAHPGHVSLETSDCYLSIGADLRPPNNDISFNTRHPIVFSKDLRKECLGTNRIPEKRIDLHSLDVAAINNSIKEFIGSKKIYSLLGDRFNLADGESCATACYICLMSGGLDELLRIDDSFLTRNSILTPLMLAKFLRKAQENEFKLYKEALSVSSSFCLEEKKRLDKIQAEIEEINSTIANEQLITDSAQHTKLNRK
jgi:hypothetical protein